VKILSDIYVTTAKAAILLNVSPVTIWRWVNEGKLKAEKVGRELLVKKSDLSGVTKSRAGRKPKRGGRQRKL
jgi:excisionase family DNA binding protein